MTGSCVYSISAHVCAHTTESRVCVCVCTFVLLSVSLGCASRGQHAQAHTLNRWTGASQTWIRMLLRCRSYLCTSLCLRIYAYMHACCYKAAVGMLTYLYSRTKTDLRTHIIQNVFVCIFTLHAYTPTRPQRRQRLSQPRVCCGVCVCMRRQCGSSVWMCDRVLHVQESVRVRHVAPTDLAERLCPS